MKSELTIIPGTRIALFRSVGQIAYEDRLKNIGRMAEFCNENRLKALIVDLRQQESDVKTMQMFTLGRSVPKVLKGIRIAVVCKATDEKTQFGETVAANRGAESRSFTTIDDARKWLESKNLPSDQRNAGDNL